MTDFFKVTDSDYQLPKRYTTSRNPRYNSLIWVAGALAVLCAFLAGLYLGADVEASRPVSPATDAGFVSVVGHEGETLVVGPNLQLRWCEATDHACHGTDS
jgi:hypothetical protein